MNVPSFKPHFPWHFIQVILAWTFDLVSSLLIVKSCKFVRKVVLKLKFLFRHLLRINVNIDKILNFAC